MLRELIAAVLALVLALIVLVVVAVSRGRSRLVLQLSCVAIVLCRCGNEWQMTVRAHVKVLAECGSGSQCKKGSAKQHFGQYLTSSLEDFYPSQVLRIHMRQR